MGAYTKSGEPILVQIPVGAVAATATRAGGRLPTGFIGEIIAAELIQVTAITGDNTNRYSVQLNKGTVAAGQEVSYIDFVAAVNTVANTPFGFTLSGNGQAGSTTLNGALTAGATSVVITSAASFPQTGSFRCQIDNEIVLVTAGAGTTTFTITRGRDTTKAAAHLTGATITLFHNQTTRRVTAGDVLHAVLTKNGTGASFDATAFINVWVAQAYDGSAADAF